MDFKISLLLLPVIFLYSFVASAEDHTCKGKPADQIQAKFVKRKNDVEDVMASTIKLIQSLADSEKMAKRNYDISSSVSYSLIGAGVAGGFAGAGVTALGGGVASLSLRVGTYVAGNTLRANTVGIGGELMTGAAAGGLGRAWYLFDGKENKINVKALNYSYRPVKAKLLDPEEKIFTETRTELSEIQRKMANTKGANSFLNWNNEREKNKMELSSINNFYLLQLLALEYETLKKALSYLSTHCESEMIYLDIDINAEKKKIFESYAKLEKMNLEDTANLLRQQHEKSEPSVR